MDKITLHPFQRRVKELVQQGQSVILQAPTGAGKTLAALAPFIENFFDAQPDQFPRKCIYSVPMRILANQFEEEYKRLAKAYATKHRRGSMKVSIQTGARPEDTRVENNLVFTTIDQTLSNFLNIPYGVGRRSANLNAGAVLSSYLVFDELHLFDPDTMLPTTLLMLQMLKEWVPFVVMTATFSSSMLGQLASILDAVVVPMDEAERDRLGALPSQQGKVRRFHAVDSPLTAERVLEHRGRRTICICNTVAAAQTLYDNLRQKLASQEDEETVLKLIHSRFYDTDRRAKEAWIAATFDTAQASYDGPPLILVATQVIEVGVDATCDVMHTEVAPAASLLQRAGRCARRANEQGEVIIYLPRTEEGEPDFTPYFLPSKAHEMQRGKQLCEATWAALASPAFQGQTMSFVREQRLIDLVHTPVDNQILEDLRRNGPQHRKAMLDCMAEQDIAAAPALIRNIDSRFVFIHPTPGTDEALEKSPWHYEGFGIRPGTLARAFNELLDVEADWIMKAAYEVTEEREFGQDLPSRQPRHYKWVPISEAGEVYGSPALALHPEAVSYDEERGLRFQVSRGAPQSPIAKSERAWERYSYQRETYAEHVAGLYSAYRRGIPEQQLLPLADEVAYVLNRLELQRWGGLSRGTLDQVIRACIACHDLGKLGQGWQDWAHGWQATVGRFWGEDRSVPTDYMAAHTDYDPTDRRQRAAQKQSGSRPPHAGESAVMALPLLATTVEQNRALLFAAATAIARHHSPVTSSFQPISAHAAARPAQQEALTTVGLPESLASVARWQLRGDEPLARQLVSFGQDSLDEVLLYLLLVRVLRLADQRSQMI